MSDDPYVYPGTDVLRNIPGIRDGDELERFEARLTFLRGLQLAFEPVPGAYDLDHLQAFHRYLFAGLYEWAGDLRTVVLAKTDLFCLPEHIKSYGAEIFGKLAEEGGSVASIATASSTGSPITSVTSMPCILFATATAAPSALSSPSWLQTPATGSTGNSSTCRSTRTPP